MNILEPITEIIDLLSSFEYVEVAWLYGSRSNGTFDEQSDYDLAVAFNRGHIEYVTSAVDEIHYQLNQIGVGLPVSVLDINRAPVPLGNNVIDQGEVIFCRSSLRLRTEEQRIWSLWEEYRYQHEFHRK